MSEPISKNPRAERMAADAQSKITALEAILIINNLLINGRQIRIDNTPIQELIAGELGLKDPERVEAQQEVTRLLKLGAGVVDRSLDNEKLRLRNASSILAAAALSETS